MEINKRTILTIASSALIGSLIGGLITGYAAAYFLGQFFSDGSALASSNQLNLNISALESIRSGNNENAIEQLEMEAKINLIAVGAYDEYVSSSTSTAIERSITNAKKYFEKHPVKYVNDDERILVEQALEKVE
ncbi:MAG: hypothetical protein PVI92_12270 [Chromatiales bacterium]|jgi:predicted lipid-binding transport protein (Tim44 family)